MVPAASAVIELHGACGFGRKRGACGFGRKRVFLQFLLHGACGFGRKRFFLQLLLSFGFLVLTSNTFFGSVGAGVWGTGDVSWRGCQDVH